MQSWSSGAQHAQTALFEPGQHDQQTEQVLEKDDHLDTDHDRRQFDQYCRQAHHQRGGQGIADTGRKVVTA